MHTAFDLYYNIAPSRVVVVITSQPCQWRHPSITVNSNRSHHSGHTTGDGRVRGMRSGSCLCSKLTDGLLRSSLSAVVVLGMG